MKRRLRATFPTSDTTTQLPNVDVFHRDPGWVVSFIHESLKDYSVTNRPKFWRKSQTSKGNGYMYILSAFIVYFPPGLLWRFFFSGLLWRFFPPFWILTTAQFILPANAIAFAGSMNRALPRFFVFSFYGSPSFKKFCSRWCATQTRTRNYGTKTPTSTSASSLVSVKDTGHYW